MHVMVNSQVSKGYPLVRLPLSVNKWPIMYDLIRVVFTRISKVNFTETVTNILEFVEIQQVPQ